MAQNLNATDVVEKPDKYAFHKAYPEGDEEQLKYVSLKRRST